jgi:AcrR family transcriptional regulator
MKVDARTQHTREILINTLNQMLDTVPLATITVDELSARAGVTRSTFYRHFTNLDDMMDNLLEEIMSDFREKLKSVQPDEVEPLSFIMILTEVLYRHQAINQIFIKANNYKMAYAVMELLRRPLVHYWRHRTGIRNLSVVDDLYIYHVYGGFGIIERWIKTGFRRSPADVARSIWNEIERYNAKPI